MNDLESKNIREVSKEISKTYSKKILIVTYYFAPMPGIPPVRATKFAKYLKKMGYFVDVLCFNPNDESSNRESLEDIKDLDNVFRIAHSKLLSDFISIKKGLKRDITGSTGDSLNTKINNRYYLAWFFSIFKSLSWSCSCKSFIRQNFQKNYYDCVFASSGPLASLIVGLYLRKKGYTDKLISDFRDPLTNEDSPSFIYKCMKLIQKSFIKKSDKITTVSLGVKNVISTGYKHIDSKISVLSNGFDELPSDFKNHCLLDKNKLDENKLNFAYCGSLYRGKADLSMFFTALTELIVDKQIDIDKISFTYAGTGSAIICSIARQYALENILNDKAFVERDMSLSIQLSSDILVMATWNTKKEQGVITGKFFEYMSNLKPIICLVSGNEAKSEVAEMIYEMNLGLACDYIEYQKNLNKLKRFIKILYDQKMNNGKIDFSSNESLIKNYHHKELAKKLSSLISEI